MSNNKCFHRQRQRKTKQRAQTYMSSNPLLKIPFAARVIQFASQTLSDALRLATVTSVFEETIYDYKVGQGILHHFDECIAQKKQSNVSVVMRRQLLKESGGATSKQGELMSLILDCFEKHADYIEGVKNGSIEPAENPEAIRREMNPETFAASSYEEKLEIFKSMLGPREIRLYQAKLGFLLVSVSGTNFEVELLAHTCAKNGLSRMFRALIIDWGALKNPKIGDKEIIFEKKSSFKPRPSTCEKSVYAKTRFTFVDVLINDYFMAALKAKQKDFLKEFFGMFSSDDETNNKSSNGNNNNNNNKHNDSEYDDSAKLETFLADKIFWNSNYPTSDEIRQVMAEDDDSESSSDDDETDERLHTATTAETDEEDNNSNSKYVVKAVYKFGSEHPLKAAIERDYREAIIDLVLKSKMCDPYAIFPKGLSFETCFDGPIDKKNLSMVKFLVNDCKISVEKLCSEENLKRNDVETNFTSPLVNVMHKIGVNQYEIAEKDWQKNVSDADKKLRLEFIKFFVIDCLPNGENDKNNLKARSENFRHLLSSLIRFISSAAKPSPCFHFPLEIAGPKCWQCGEEFGLIFRRKGTCERCGVVCCSKCKDSGRCPACVIDGKV